MTKNAIFSLVLGDPNKYKTCLTSIVNYSKKYNAPFFIASQIHINFINHYFEKFQCLELLNDYDRVLCLDADILITPNAENIFEKYSDQNYLYAFHENDDNETMNRDKWIDAYNPDFEWPLYNNRKLYFNSGCVLYSKKHKDILDKIKQIKFTNKCFSIDGGEQSALNYAIAKNNIPFQTIDYSFNRMNLGKNDPDNLRYKSNFIHYAGICMYGNGNKQETIEEDYKKLYNQT